MGWLAPQVWDPGADGLGQREEEIERKRERGRGEGGRESGGDDLYS